MNFNGFFRGGTMSWPRIFVQSVRSFTVSTHRLMAAAMPDTVYDFTVKDANGKEVKLDKYRGKPLIIVNVASQCGFADKSYQQLKELQELFKDKGLAVAAFPCNQFKSQEPGCAIDVSKGVKDKYHYEPDIYEKIEVNGENAHPLYKFLKKEQGGIFGDSIKWNFTKFLIDQHGRPVKRYAPTTSPMSMKGDIEALFTDGK